MALLVHDMAFQRCFGGSRSDLVELLSRGRRSMPAGSRPRPVEEDFLGRDTEINVIESRERYRILHPLSTGGRGRDG